MNRSGKSVRYWLDRLKIQPSNLIVLVDEIQLSLGKIRIKPNGSDGGHNGLKDIIQSLGSQNFPRLRFGIGREFGKGQQVDYVLGEWNQDEVKVIEERKKMAAKAVLAFGAIGIQRAMNQYNG